MKERKKTKKKRRSFCTRKLLKVEGRNWQKRKFRKEEKKQDERKKVQKVMKDNKGNLTLMIWKGDTKIMKM